MMLSGKTATRTCIPDDIIEKTGAGKKQPLKVTLNGCYYRHTVTMVGGKYILVVNADSRVASGA